MRYVCTKPCFYVRLWNPGEILNAGANERVPAHFVLEKDYNKPQAESFKTPNTLHEISKAEEKETKKLLKGKFAKDADFLG